MIAPNAAVEENAFYYCEKLHIVLVNNGDYECNYDGEKCKKCPKCLGTWD